MLAYIRPTFDGGSMKQIAEYYKMMWYLTMNDKYRELHEMYKKLNHRAEELAQDATPATA